MKIKTLYILYNVYLTLIWTIVACLSIELGFRLLLLGANYLYAPFFESQTRKVYGMAPVNEKGSRSPIKVSNTANTTTGHSTSHPNMSKQTLKNPNDCKEEYLLTLHGILKAEFGMDGKILKMVGDPILRNYLRDLYQGTQVTYNSPEWEELINSIKKHSGLPIFTKLKYNYTHTHYYEVTVETHPNVITLTAKEVRDNYPYSLTDQKTYDDPNSPWLVLCFAYKPNYHPEKSLSQYNNYGFRDDDVVIPKPQDTIRIVCIGGSTTEEGNSNDATYPNIMERKLRYYFHTDKIDVINAGICGIRSSDEVRRIWDYLNLQPDLIIYYNLINDICYCYLPEWLKLPNPYRKYLKISPLRIT